MENNDVIDGGGQILSFAAIMNSPFSRRYFYAFLENQGKQDLLGFWAAVEELKESEKLFWHQLATGIEKNYFLWNQIVIKKISVVLLCYISEIFREIKFQSKETDQIIPWIIFF